MTQAVSAETMAMIKGRYSNEMQKCIEACNDCYAVCAVTMQYSLEKGGMRAQPEHIRLLLDCAQICRISAEFMLRGSKLHTETCRTCSVVCSECEKDCSKMRDDEVMRRCADACRSCAEECRRMSSH